MSNISVALSTTKFISVPKSDTGGDVLRRRMIENNIPTCISQLGLGLFGFGADKEWFEHISAQSCLSMVKTVSIDPKLRTVFIGVDPSNEETGLVIYQEMRDSDYVKEFFLRWEQTKMLLFEHHCIGFDGKPIFVLRGFWDTNHWESVNIFPFKSIDVDQSRSASEESFIF